LRLVVQLIRPYRNILIIILLAMLVETAMSLAAPWPLKIIIDSVAGNHKLPEWMYAALTPVLGTGSKLRLALLAAMATVLIAIIGAVASYIDNYFTESVGQYVAHDLRMRTFHHLQRLSLGYYSKHQTGELLSTITTDIATVQDFASSSTLDILVDVLTIFGMLGLMFWLDWDFTLIALACDTLSAVFRIQVQESGKEGYAQGSARTGADCNRRSGGT
jgi:subfamily B ATP-binding cassette protein MsbA